MKKILKLFIFIFICFMPFMVEAETKLVYEWKVEDSDFITSIDGKYYFKNFEDNDFINIYDKFGSFLEKEDNVFYQRLNLKVEEFYNNELLMAILKSEGLNLKYNESLNKYYSTEYDDNIVMVYGEMATDEPTIFELDNPEHEDEIKELMGKEYDLYLLVSNSSEILESITYQDGYYLVKMNYRSGGSIYYVYNESFELVYEDAGGKPDNLKLILYNDRIYEIDNNTNISIYDLKGNLLINQNIRLDLEKIYREHYFYLQRFYVKDNNLVIQYDHWYNSPTGMYGNDGYNDYGKSEIVNPFLTVKYRIDSDIEYISSENGESIGEKKTDELDREYVELKITPKDGYVIDEVIVTDVNGNKIEVKDNKFYMPMSDVKVEVKYKGGEYLPIPNTALSQNISFILIGIILIGLGMYTMNFIKREEN